MDDLGLQGLGILVVISLAFGVLAQLVAGGRTGTRWLWLIAGAGWFVGGLITSEVLFAGVSEEDLQPVIDGLAFDESLLGGLVVGVVTVIVTLISTGGSRSHRTMSP